MNKTKIIIATLLTALAVNANAQFSQLGNRNEFMLKMELGYAPFVGNVGQAGEHGYYLPKYHQAAGLDLMAGCNFSQDWFLGGGIGLNYYLNPQLSQAASLLGVNAFADIDFRPIWEGLMGLDYQPATIKWAPMVGARLGGSVLMGQPEPDGYGTTITPLGEFYVGLNWFYLHGLRNMEHNWRSLYVSVGVAYMQQTVFLPVRLGWRL